MKRVLFFIASILWLAAAAFDDTPFYDAIDKEDFEQAESILAQWEGKCKDNPEVIIARFNLLVNKAHNSYLVLDKDVDNVSDEALVFVDEEGNPAGMIRSGLSWNDSLVNEAVKVIDRGIALYPDRLDMRFGKASLYQFVENWDSYSATAIDVLERAQSNGCKWLWADNKVLSESNSRESMLDAIHEYERTLANNTANQNLLDHNLKYYPDDHIALTLKGAIAYEAGDTDTTLEFMNRAHRAAPDDMLIVCNLAILYKEKKDFDMAKKLYQSILDNPAAETQWKLEAEEALKQL